MTKEKKKEEVERFERGTDAGAIDGTVAAQGGSISSWTWKRSVSEPRTFALIRRGPPVTLPAPPEPKRLGVSGI
ncbi:MAG: hypothetical protein AAGC67_02330 [Myxococcota bacterium]